MFKFQLNKLSTELDCYYPVGNFGGGRCYFLLVQITNLFTAPSSIL